MRSQAVRLRNHRDQTKSLSDGFGLQSTSFAQVQLLRNPYECWNIQHLRVNFVYTIDPRRRILAGPFSE